MSALTEDSLVPVDVLQLKDITKRVKNVLQSCDRLISHYRRHMPGVRHLSLYSADFKALSDLAKANNKQIDQLVYNGFGFKRAHE